MTSRAQELLREALTLPIAERADVAAELVASLDDAEAEDPAAVESAWAAEIEKRARCVLADESAGVKWTMSVGARTMKYAGHDRASAVSRSTAAGGTGTAKQQGDTHV